MRIALFTECYRPIVNGVVVSVCTFAGELRKLGHEVQVIAPGYPGYCDTESDIYRLPSVCPPTSPRYPLALPYTSYRLRRLFREQPPDIIHAQHPFACSREGRRWARKLGCPFVYTYHTLIRAYAHYVPLPGFLVRAAAVKVSRDFSNSADCVVVPTNGIKELLRSYGVNRPIEVIPTGVDLELLRGHVCKPVRGRLGIPESVPLIVYSGRIAKEKTIETVIEALGILSKNGSEAHLVLVGGGPWEDNCKKLAEQLKLSDRFHITGYLAREEVFDWLAEADAYCFPSLTDTQGVAVLEAMAMGCPPVAVRSGAVEDVIRDKVDGLLVSPNAEAVAEALGSLLGNEELRLRFAGQARARAEEFSASRMAERLVGVYRRLLDR